MKHNTCNPNFGINVKEEYLDAEEGDEDKIRNQINDVHDEVTHQGEGTFTDMFEDCVRRTDYVLVINEYDGARIDPFKLKFLLNLVRLGLQLEFHKGTTKSRKNLLFVKIHAPEQVLDQFAEPLGLKKIYKDTHLQYVGSCLTGDEIFLNPEHEKGWLKFIREKCTMEIKLSNNERSMIVHMLLRYQLVDDEGNYLGIQRLLSHGIILDAYALHDGPYFFAEDQESVQDANARQILYYNWIGPENIFRYQPKHLIQEYFGPKIGFFFTYYEFYNKFLFILSWAAIVAYVLGYNIQQNERFPCRDFYSSHIVPECSNWTLCHFLQKWEVCLEARWTYYFDNDYVLYYSFFVLLWAISLYVCWRRQEMFYIWIWEQKYLDPVQYIRPEYRGDHGKLGWQYKDGRWINQSLTHYKVVRYAVGAAVAIGIVNVAGYIYYQGYKLHLEWTGSMNKITQIYPILGRLTFTGRQQVLALLIVGVYCIMFVLELVGRRLVRAALMLENHRTQNGHERRQAVLLFSLACLSCFPIPMFFGWIKGAFFSYPRNLTFELFNLNCAKESCLDQFVLAVIALTMLRLVLWKAISFWACSWTTDFSMNIETLASMPSWERESVLKPVTEIQFVEYYNELVVQFAIIVLLSPWFLVMPAIAFIVNWCDIKYKASLILKYSRRPTLYPTDGIMQWNTILKGIIVFIPIIHAITLSRMLKYGILDTYHSTMGCTVNKQYNVEYFKFNNEDMKKYDNILKEQADEHIRSGTLPWQSYAIGVTYEYNTESPFPWNSKLMIDNVTGLAPIRHTFHKEKYDFQFVFCYFHIGVLIFLTVLYFVPSKIPWVLRYMKIEKALKRLYVVNQVKIPDIHLPIPIPKPLQSGYPHC